MSTKTLPEVLRAMKVGQKKRVIAANANTCRVTAARVFGAGNYSVHTISNTEFEVVRKA